MTTSPPSGQTVPVNGIEMYYESRGEGEPLVLLHGGSQNAHTFDTVAMALDRPLVAIDLPGHGHSDGPAAPREGQLDIQANAADVATVIRQLAPAARAVAG